MVHVSSCDRYCCFQHLVLRSFVRVLRSETDTNLAEMANNFVVAVNAEQSDEDKQPQTAENIAETLDAFRFRDYQFAVMSADGKLIGKTTEFDLPSAIQNSAIDQFADRSINNEWFRVFQRSFQYRRRYGSPFCVPLFDQQDRNRGPPSLFFADRNTFRTVLGRHWRSSCCTPQFWPIKQMSDQAGLITSKNLHERLPVANKNDELGMLSTVFNDLLDRLNKSFDQQRRFMADASHELRTPLAIVRGESEVALTKDRNADEYRESLAIVHDESKRLTQIVDDLFTLARADSGNFAAKFAEVYVAEIVTECVRSIRTLAHSRNISVELTAEEMRIDGDESLLRRLIMNLLDNALKYNHKNGRISVVAKNNQILLQILARRSLMMKRPRYSSVFIVRIKDVREAKSIRQAVPDLAFRSQNGSPNFTVQSSGWPDLKTAKIHLPSSFLVNLTFIFQ